MAAIAWFIPQLIQGSGGHRTILAHAHALEVSGHDCTIYIEGSGEHSRASALIEKLFGYKFANVRYGWRGATKADVAVATIWYSAAFVRDLPFDCIKCYFVQDYEALFNPMGDAYLLAENSYRYGLIPITIGRWLKHELAKRFQVPAFHFDFGADHSIYKVLPEVRRSLSVCFIYQPDKPRRCSRLGIEALGIVKHKRPDVNIVLYGSAVADRDYVWFEHEHRGLMSLEECNALYNECSVGLCLSSSNPSRIPFEMMASGLPVVELWRDNNLYDVPDKAVSLSEQTPESIAENVLRLLDDPAARETMSQAGVAFMRNRSLASETGKVVSIIEDLIEGVRPELTAEPRLYRRKPVVAGRMVADLPPEISRILTVPRNSYVNTFPDPVRRALLWSMRKARRMLQAY